MKRFHRILARTAPLVIAIALLLPWGPAQAMNKTDKTAIQKPVVMQGTVTNIQGNIVTIRDTAGVEQQFELNSAAGIQIGASAWCEEDCGKGLKIGDRGITVKRVLGIAPRR